MIAVSDWPDAADDVLDDDLDNAAPWPSRGRFGIFRGMNLLASSYQRS